MDMQLFEERKKDHIREALHLRNQADGRSGLDLIHLPHEALPDFDFAEVDLRAQSITGVLATPFFVSGMTAGHAAAGPINDRLAQACERRGWAMGVGSQRRDLESEERAGEWISFRDRHPTLELYANLGITQVISTSTSAMRRVVDQIGASALVIHTNPLQEVLQPEGTPDFRGGLDAIRRVCAELSVPVIVKETGSGFSPSTLSRLGGTGVRAVDVSGLGGTHWGRIEGARAPSDSVHALAAETFRNWGESTVNSVISATRTLPKEVLIFASGGVRSGLAAAKLISIGAHRVGYAQPALQAVVEDIEKNNHALERWMELQEYELKTAMFCTGSKTLDDLARRGSL